MENKDNYKDGVDGYIIYDGKPLFEATLTDIDFDTNDIYIDLSDDIDLETKIWVEEQELFTLDDFRPINETQFKKFLRYKQSQPKRTALYENGKLVEVFDCKREAKKRMHECIKSAELDWLDVDYCLKPYKD